MRCAGQLAAVTGESKMEKKDVHANALSAISMEVVSNRWQTMAVAKYIQQST